MKRDIRAQDHEPLQMADSSPLPYIILYLFEPSFIESPDTSLRHLQFQYQSILHFNSNAALTGKHIHLFHVEAADAFAFIQSKYDICEVLAIVKVAQCRHGNATSGYNHFANRTILHGPNAKKVAC